jgi:hypothetical protein
MAMSYMQPGFVSGEMAPSLYGRIDLAKYRQGASVMRNAFVSYKGGILSRAGSAYVGMCKQGAPNAGTTPTSYPPRDIKFQFNINQGFDLEFGDEYMRVVSNGAYVTDTPKNVSAITNASPGVITISSHGYSNGDWVFGANIGGMQNFNGLSWIVQNATTNTFTLTDLFGNTVNSGNFPAFTSGGTFARIYTVTSPYAAVDLSYLKFTQSSNTMSLTCVNQVTGTEYLPYELLRIADNNWTFTAETFASAIEAPLPPTGTAVSSTTANTWYSYVITAVDAQGEESIASNNVDLFNNDIAINAGSNTIYWKAVPGATSYNIYAATSIYSTGADPGFIGASYGFVGSSFGASFTDTNITADFTTTPPLHNNPFARGAILAVVPTSGGSGLSQATIEYEITTSTGSGFAGEPIIVNGNFVGFLIFDNGEKYAVGDTISLITGGVAATGSYTFTENPTDGQNIILNGVTWTFKTTPTGGSQTQIGVNLAATLTQLASDLHTSGQAVLTAAKYAVTSGTILSITFGELGITGNAYTLAAGTYGGTVSGANLTGGTNGTASGATGTLTIGPESGTYPGLVSYYQQRRVYANTLNNPDTYYMSQTGAYANFDASIPNIDSDAIIGTPWAQQVNGIQALLVSPTGLLAFCGNGAWLINGGAATAITPADQSAQSQAYNGISPFVPPVAINYHILYVQSKGSIVRDLAFNIFVNVYTGEDITIISNHLFSGFTIPQMAYAEEPFKVNWCVRNDGAMLSLTYLSEQDIKAWARHDTNGLYVGVTTVTEPPVDAVYVIVQRYVNGVWVYYKERFDNRHWVLAEDCFCVDAGLSYPMTYPAATLSPSAATGTANITGALYIAGGNSYAAPSALAIDPTGNGSGATFSVEFTPNGPITGITSLAVGKNYSSETYFEITDSIGTGALYNPVITNNVNFSASASVFTSGMVGDVIRVGNGQAVIESYVSGTEVVANITQPITATVPNDPNLTVIPAISGEWSIATPTDIVTGLNHIQGLTVTGLADGGVITPRIVGPVTGGIGITLPAKATAINVGLPFIVQGQTMQLDFPDAGGTSQSKRKNISGVDIRFEQSRGISVGTNQPIAATLPGMINPVWTDMIEVKESNPDVPLGQAIPLITGDYYLPVYNDWNTEGRVAFQQTNPLPCNILAVVTRHAIGDTSSP